MNKMKFSAFAIALLAAIPYDASAMETNNLVLPVGSVEEEDGSLIVEAILTTGVRISNERLDIFLDAPAGTVVQGEAAMSGRDRCIHWSVATFPDGSLHEIDAVPSCTHPVVGSIVSVRMLRVARTSHGEKPSSSSGGPLKVR